MGRTPPGEDENWISSKDALEMAINAFGNRKQADKQLNRRASMGTLKTRAQAFLTQPDLGPIPTNLPSHPLPGFKLNSPAERLGIVLGPAFWRNSGRSVYERKLWKWTNGVFAMVNMANSLVIRQAPGTDCWTQNVNERHVYFGVSFLKHEIEAFLISAKKPVEKTKPVKRQRPRPINYDWDAILEPLVEIAKAGNLEKEFGPFGRRGTKKSIADRIQREVWKRHPGIGDAEGASYPILKRKTNLLIDLALAAKKVSQ
jgi:hypothetical protein